MSNVVPLPKFKSPRSASIKSPTHRHVPVNREFEEKVFNTIKSLNSASQLDLRKMFSNHSDELGKVLINLKKDGLISKYQDKDKIGNISWHYSAKNSSKPPIRSPNKPKQEPKKDKSRTIIDEVLNFLNVDFVQVYANLPADLSESQKKLLSLHINIHTYFRDKLNCDGFYYRSRKNINKKLNWSDRQITRTTRELIDMKYLYRKRKGNKIYYRVDFEKLKGACLIKGQINE